MNEMNKGKVGKQTNKQTIPCKCKIENRARIQQRRLASWTAVFMESCLKAVVLNQRLRCETKASHRSKKVRSIESAPPQAAHHVLKGTSC